MGRRQQLLEQATDHALRHGLIGLSLRPLAAALGTSDRMLLYHFGTRDELVTAVIEEANRRSVHTVERLPPAASVASGAWALWQAYQQQPLRACEQLYLQAAASGLLGQEPYRSGVRRANEAWTRALSGWLLRCGADPARLGRVVALVDATLLGLHLGLATEDPDSLDQAARDLAAAAAALADARPAVPGADAPRG